MGQRARYEGVKSAAGIIFRLTGSSQTWNGKSLLSVRLPICCVHQQSPSRAGRKVTKRVMIWSMIFLRILFRGFLTFWMKPLMNICVNENAKIKIGKGSRLQVPSCQTFTLHVIANERWKRKTSGWKMTEGCNRGLLRENLSFHGNTGLNLL